MGQEAKPKIVGLVGNVEIDIPDPLDGIDITDPRHPDYKKPDGNEEEFDIADPRHPDYKKPADDNDDNPDDIKFKEGEVIAVEIDGKQVNLTIDKDGNAINEEGKVIYTATEMVDFSDEEDAPASATIDDIAAISGISITDKDGKPKQYTNTIEGFAQREADIKQLGIEEGRKAALALFFKENPDLENIHKYKQINGTIDNFSTFVDYSKVTIDTTNEQQMLDIIVKAEMQRGATKERAERIANLSKLDNTLVADSQESLSFLTTTQQSKIEAHTKQEQAAIAQAIEEENKYYGVAYDEKGQEKILNIEGSIYDMVVVKGKIGDIAIPKDGLNVKKSDGTVKHFSRRELFDYISTPVVDIEGELYTQAQVDEYNRLRDKNTVVSRFIANLVGNDLSELIQISKLQDKANTVRVVKKVSNPSSGRKPNSGNGTVIIPVK